MKWLLFNNCNHFVSFSLRWFWICMPNFCNLMKYSKKILQLFKYHIFENWKMLRDILVFPLIFIWRCFMCNSQKDEIVNFQFHKINIFLFHFQTLYLCRSNIAFCSSNSSNRNCFNLYFASAGIFSHLLWWVHDYFIWKILQSSLFFFPAAVNFNKGKTNLHVQ